MELSLVRLSLLAFLFAGCVPASQLIVNGTFETGTLSGWTVSVETNSQPGSNFFASTSKTPPLSGSGDYLTAGPASGTYYAISDDTGPAALVLSQSFTVPTHNASVILSFSMFDDSNTAGNVNTSNGLDFNQIDSQFGIVSLLTAGTSVFSTGSGDLDNFYEGVGAVATNNPYTNYSFDISSLVSAGGTYIIRFGAVNNVDQLNVGVDNVSVTYTAAATAPEPAPMALTFAGLAAIYSLTSKRRRASPR